MNSIQSCDEKVIMRTFIDVRAPKTREYAKYIFATLLEQVPLTKGANVEIAVIENQTPFPKLVEIPEGSPDIKRMSAELSNWAVRHPGRFGLLYDYTNELLSSMCTPLTPTLQPEIRINMLFNYVIDDPEKIYREAQKLGLKIPKEITTDQQNVGAPATFSEQPAQIRWMGELIPIPPNSKQLCVCRVAFRKPVGEVISWDEVADEIDQVPEQDRKTSKKNVYDTVRQINKKISTATGEPLFKAHNLSFSRLA